METNDTAVLTLLVEEREPYLFCLGGSFVSERRNPMSDTDLFVVGPLDGEARFRKLVSLFEKADLEWRSTAWLAEIGLRLKRFSPDLAGGPSPFGYPDLRFLARILLGVVLADRDGLAQQVKALEDPLRRALAAYNSTYYINTYEDVLGLHRAGRHRDVLALAGELAQRAALLGLLQTRLVEPASKWALGIAAAAPVPGLAAAADAMLDHLGAYDADAPSHWVASLLRLANRLVAEGALAELSPAGSELDLLEIAPPSEGICVMGVPSYLTVIDLENSRVSVCNPAYLRQFVEGWVASGVADPSRTMVVAS
jgi:hypothetical protein